MRTIEHDHDHDHGHIHPKKVLTPAEHENNLKELMKENADKLETIGIDSEKLLKRDPEEVEKLFEAAVKDKSKASTLKKLFMWTIYGTSFATILYVIYLLMVQDGSPSHYPGLDETTGGV